MSMKRRRLPSIRTHLRKMMQAGTRITIAHVRVVLWARGELP